MSRRRKKDKYSPLMKKFLQGIFSEVRNNIFEKMEECNDEEFDCEKVYDEELLKVLNIFIQPKNRLSI